MRGLAAVIALGTSLVAGSSAAQQDAATYPFVVEESITRWELAADGTGQAHAYARYRIENDGGVQLLGQILEPYLSSRLRVEVQSVRVHHADGSVDELAKGNVRDLPAPVTAAFPVYTDLHVLHITPPSMRPGDVLEMELIREIIQPDAPGQFWIQYAFNRNTIVESETLEVLVPDTAPVKVRAAEDLDSEVEETDGGRLYRWTHRQDEVEAPEEKPFNPHALTQRPDIELTSFGDWSEVGDWYAGLALDRAQPDRQIRRKAEELLEGLTEDRARIAALYDFVRREFRYLSLSLGLARYQPHHASEVLASGYGDCKDKHTLLAALLTAAGYEALPVAVGVLREPTPEVPSPGQFDHVITAVRLGGETLWLDSTSAVNPFGYIGAAIRGKQALLVEPQGESRLVELPDRLPYDTFTTTRLEGRVDPDGTLHGTVTLTGRGDGETMLRATLINTAGPQHTEYGKSLLEAWDIEAELKEIETGDPADTTEPLRTILEIRQEDFVSPFQESQQVRLPSLDGILSSFEEGEESLLLGEPARYTVEVDLTFPEGTRLEPPLPMALERDFATLHSQFEMSGSRLTGKRVLDVRVDELAAEHRNAYQRFRSSIESDGKQTLGLTFPEGVLADTEEIQDADRLYRAGLDAYRRDAFEDAVDLFEHATEIDPEHDDAWEELGRSLGRAGRADAAVAALRRQLEVTPHHATARSNLGWALEEAGDAEAAIEAFREQLQNDPSNEYSIEKLGRLLWSRQEYEESLPYLRRAARNDPDDASLAWRLADSELHAGDDGRAATLLEPLAETDDTGVLTDALWELAQHRHLSRLVPLLDRLEELAPDDSSTWTIRGWYERASGQNEAAHAAFTRALDLDPNNSDAQIELAAALYRLERFDEAIPLYRGYLEDNPSDTDTRFWLGECLLAEGEPEAAIREFRSVLDRQPDDLRALFGLARAHLATDDQPAAADVLSRARSAAGDDFEKQLMLAALYKMSGQASEAKALTLGLYDRRNEVELPCGVLAWSLFETEAYAKAESVAEECLAKDSASGQAHHVLGLNFSRQGRYEAALPHLEQAAELYSDGFADQEVLDYVRQQVSASNGQVRVQDP